MSPQQHECLTPSALLAPLQDRDGPFAGVTLKQREYEEAMCAELGLLCGAFLIARAKWNQTAGSDACIARISEVRADAAALHESSTPCALLGSV